MKTFECSLCKCTISVNFDSKYDGFDSELNKLICLNCGETGNLEKVSEWDLKQI